MKVFKEFNDSGKNVCPICGTKDKKETVLIGVEGTEDGNNIQAIQVHLDCLELRFNDKRLGDGKKLIYQVIGEIK